MRFLFANCANLPQVAAAGLFVRGAVRFIPNEIDTNRDGLPPGSFRRVNLHLRPCHAPRPLPSIPADVPRFRVQSACGFPTVPLCFSFALAHPFSRIGADVKRRRAPPVVRVNLCKKASNRNRTGEPCFRRRHNPGKPFAIRPRNVRAF